jgi:beta-lactamase superfamily II metal-dependent hydrolase
MLVNDNSIEIHLAGPGFGEGVLIIIGGTVIIGIDSCRSFVQRPDDRQSLLEQKLYGIKSPISLFWILTHFHSDHFQCFSSILNQFGDKLKSVVVPLDYTNADIAFNASAYEARVSLDEDAAYYLAKGEYRRIRELLDSEYLQHLYTSGSGKQVLVDTQLKTSEGQLLTLQVHVHGLQRQMLNHLLGKEIPLALENEDNGAKSREAANKGSYIIHIIYGKFEGLFLGDAPCIRTAEVLSERKHYDAEIMLLKVAHHGSDDGTNKSLIESFCDTLSPVTARYAMIAPFKHNKLPREEVIELLKNHGFEVRISGAEDSEEARDNISKDFKPLTKVSLSEGTAAGGDIIMVRFDNL